MSNNIINTYVTGLSKDFKEMLAVNASFNALSVKDVIKASDGTRKVCLTVYCHSFLCIFASNHRNTCINVKCQRR